jgi:hypothetical protein
MKIHFDYFDVAVIIATAVIVAIVAGLLLNKPWPPEPHPATLSMRGTQLVLRCGEGGDPRMTLMDPLVAARRPG